MSLVKPIFDSDPFQLPVGAGDCSIGAGPINNGLDGQFNPFFETFVNALVQHPIPFLPHRRRRERGDKRYQHRLLESTTRSQACRWRRSRAF